MDNKKQKDAFIEYEADAWFDRNKNILLNYSKDRDRVISLIQDYDLKPKNVLEIGCSAGYRLNGIKESLGDCAVFGLEPSKEAIEYGEAHFPEVNFVRGTADNLSDFADESMDVVIVGFVFYVIDRNIFFKVVSEIDRVLKNGGILIIVDFFSETALKNVYQHIKEFSAFSFKQNYDEVFTASKLYYLLDKSTWNHSEKVLDASENYYDKYSVSLLKKDISASYK
ncbi:class I SAM-dependent methyltransferase [Pedobacter gandavensis]|uniref:Methyltransferase domain-containing protein n=1 Tax=Pedobacter gandavensis TaxID=2679963 RepID=A0ABR6EXY9_9SPHI|nr:class I SAM-dependent methyltransferase [Pedobacter gandavensis]MBB2149907.1 methyltransferase domain-containing protein [Pedobacter gandavensis]